MPQDRRYLYRIGSRWYARIPVPNPLRSELGPYYQRSLGTSDIREAQRRRWDIQQEAHELFLRHQPLDPVRANYLAWRETLKNTDGGGVEFPHYGPNGELQGHTEENPTLEALLDQATHLPHDHPAHSAIGDHLQGLLPTPDLLADYLEHNPKRHKDTVANYGSVVQCWIDTHGEKSISPRWVTRRVATSWFQEATRGKAKSTATKCATVMRELWDWQFRHHDAPPENPFQNLQRAHGNGSRAPAASYEAFTDEELTRLLKATRDDPDLHPCVLVGLHSGLRLSEILEATREQVNGVECFVLRSGKTRNAKRLVPVHPELESVEITTKLNSKALSVRFSRLKRSLDLPDRATFHSLRKCFTTKLEHSGCPEAVAARLLGHRPLSISYGIYSAGQDVRQLERWVKAVSYQLD